jgi:peptide deformylase
VKDPIVQSGNPVLRAVAQPVAAEDFGSPKLRSLIDRMKSLLAGEEYGVAIAAPQVGESLRLFVVAGKALASDETETNEPESEDMVFINPTITRLSKERGEMSEGCLSVRGQYGSVVRHTKASIKAFDVNGKPFTYNGAGLIAQIFQHECDHLEGILYIDKAVTLRDEERHTSPHE